MKEILKNVSAVDLGNRTRSIQRSIDTQNISTIFLGATPLS